MDARCRRLCRGRSIRRSSQKRRWRHDAARRLDRRAPTGIVDRRRDSGSDHWRGDAGSDAGSRTGDAALRGGRRRGLVILGGAGGGEKVSNLTVIQSKEFGKLLHRHVLTETVLSREVPLEDVKNIGVEI